MSNPHVPFNEIDDYIATLSPEEQQEVAVAALALDLAHILYEARQERGLTQAAAATKAGIHQQAVSRLEKAVGNARLSTLQRYLDALGYSIDITIKDAATGQIIGQATLQTS
jgi:DNA-binding XRE family transcriptional regulator